MIQFRPPGVTDYNSVIAFSNFLTVQLILFCLLASDTIVPEIFSTHSRFINMMLLMPTCCLVVVDFIIIFNLFSLMYLKLKQFFSKE